MCPHLSEPLTEGGFCPPAPDGIEATHATAWEALYGGDTPLAKRLFQSACSIDPAQADSWAALADTDSEMGAYGEATAAYRRALSLAPGLWSWRLSLATAQLRSGDPVAAVITAGGLVDERGDAVDARLALARCYMALGQKAEAVDQQREAVLLRPGDRNSTLDLARMLEARGEALEALELLQPLARQNCDDGELHLAIAGCWIALGEPGKARTVVERAKGLDGTDPLEWAAVMARIDAFAVTGADSLSASYVRALFDRYAERFDRDLVHKLAYCGPALVQDVLDQLNLPVVGRTLDLGCGTGLAGEVLRSRTCYLAGIDLAPRMIDRARARSLYDDLAVSDIITALKEQPQAWDLLVAADVLIYVSDLKGVFTAAFDALRPGGKFIATAEAIEDGDRRLLETRRFAWSATFIRAMAAEAGLEVEVMVSASARREKGRDLPGLVFALGRPATA